MEEEFTVARLYISKMKSEVKTLVGRCGNLESASTEAKDKLHRTSSELSECKLHVQQVGGATMAGLSTRGTRILHFEIESPLRLC